MAKFLSLSSFLFKLALDGFKYLVIFLTNSFKELYANFGQM